MEDLTKQQMVLLTLLVSFVASIATSISVVTLLNETPMTVTQTINRIVERTIEKVVPAEILPPSQPPKPILPVNESELIVGAVDMNLLKMVVISSKKTGTQEGGKEEYIEHGIGFVADASGLVATDKNILGETADYFVEFSDGKMYKAGKVFTDENSPLAILQLYNDKDQNITGISSVSFASNEPKLGSAVIALGGKSAATVYQGIVSEKSEARILTNISFGAIDRGGILFGTDGKVFGMNTVAESEEKYTLPSTSILAAIEAYKNKGR